MSRVLLPVIHHPGRHCASTALCNLANFHGVAFTEAMCFGIGAGLGIWYLDAPSMSPTRMIHVRSADIEAQFFTRMGCTFSWQQHADPMDALRALCDSLDRGLPTLVQSDIYHLPYYRSKTHFPGHDITVWGYDSQEALFLITDTERDGLLEVPFEAMRRALYSRGGFFTMEGNQFSPETLGAPDDLPGVITRAIAHNSRVILSGGYDFQGILGLEKWIREISNAWPLLPDWQWAARFAYQVIERRGTGGGGFRLMYADFLEEAAACCPGVASRGLPQAMREIAAAWTALAEALRDASEAQGPDFSDARERIRRLAALEAAYHLEAQTLG
jgi:hypothetical protein